MSDISKRIGERIRNHRNRLGLNQEALAERCGLHATYIGQLERGEKSATLDSMEKVVTGLGISFETLFENIAAGENETTVAAECYEIIDSLNREEQAGMIELLKRIIDFKHI